MTPRHLFAASVFLLGALRASALPEPTVAQARAIVDKAVAGFESGAPAELSAADALVLETAPVTAKDQIALYRRLPAMLKRAQALRALRTPAKAACAEAPAAQREGNACVQAEARAIAAGLGLVDKERVEGAAAVYVAYYMGPVNNSPAEMEAAQKRALELANDPSLSQASAARAKRVLAQAGALKLAGDAGPGAVGFGGVADAGGRRTVDQALEEARRGVKPGLTTKGKVVEPPSLSERLAQSAAEDESLLQHGPDDGTWSTAVGRSVTQVKKTGSSVLSYFTSGDTWKRTGQGAVQMVTNPGETATFLPGAVVEGGGAMWHGVKADIANASDEIGAFTENPTPYRGIALAGSLTLAFSNVLPVGGGVKSGVRRGALSEIDLAAKDATQSVARTGVRDGGIGAAETAKPVTDPAARTIYKKTASQAEEIPFMMDQGIINVTEKIPTSAKQQIMYKQTGPTCVFGAVCNMYQGVADVSATDVLAAIRRENPAYSGTMAKSNIGTEAMERISNTLATKAGRTPVALSSSGDFVTHMRGTGQPVLVAVQTGSGRHAIVLSEAMVTKEGKVYFKTLDTNISVRPGAEAARGEKFGIITAEDLDKILASKGFSHT